MEIRFGNISGGGGGGQYNVEEHLYADETNRVAGPLDNIPSVNDVAIFAGPLLQDISEDFTIRPVAGGSAPGYYICIAIDSTAPGGGTFSGGVNPSVGMVSFLEADDVLTAMYSTP